MVNARSLLLVVSCSALAEIIFVFVVNCSSPYQLNHYENSTDFYEHTSSHGFFKDAIGSFYIINEQTTLYIWLIVHLYFHGMWLGTSGNLAIDALCRNDEAKVTINKILHFIVTGILVCACDLAASIHTAILVSKDELDSMAPGPKIFFPLYLAKGCVIWILNLAVFIYLLIQYLAFRRARRLAALREIVAAVRREEGDQTIIIIEKKKIYRIRPDSAGGQGSNGSTDFPPPYTEIQVPTTSSASPLTETIQPIQASPAT